METKKQPFWKSPIFYAIIAAVFLFLFLQQCSETRKIKDNRLSEREFLKDSISYYQNKLGQEVAQKAALKGDKETLEVLLSKQIDSTGQLRALVDNFRKVEAAGNITTITEIDTVFIPYDSISNFGKKIFQKNTKNYSIGGFANNDGVTIENLSIPNTLSFALGKKKTGFFKTEYRIEAVNSNPYVKTTGLDAYSLSVPRKRLGISIYVGYGASENFTFAPQIGMGVSYSIIRF